MPFNVRPPARPTVRLHHRHTNVNNSINRYGNPNATRGYFGRKWHSHPRLVKQRQLKSQSRRKRKAEIVSVSVSSCPQIWNIELEKDREKEKVGGRPAKLNEKKGNRDLEREIKNKGDSFFVGKTTWKFCSGGEKMRNPSGHQCKVKMSGSEKKIERENFSVSTEELLSLITEASSGIHSNYVPDCIYHVT